ncbi:hypothetical protein [[Clostridium] aminophilum]|uniref:Uncharacterized protein n=1 Tax=[Clostridium] aminophilum TaxID=1526 RepID=A0A1I6JJ38_9FIRM|nr:hypothetical protein [[Clostridium] aminophilum]SFR78914.1 hypothetical protein SAMN02910262_01556 [[Clostridium] aminophilum]
MQTATPFIFKNVMLITLANNDSDRFQIESYESMVRSGTVKISLKDFSNWCRGHGIAYEYRFFWRNDYPLAANLWNAINVLLWRLNEIFHNVLLLRV